MAVKLMLLGHRGMPSGVLETLKLTMGEEVGGLIEVFEVETEKDIEMLDDKIDNDLEVTGDIIAFSSSDRNLKENITVIPNALDKINSLSGNTFTWKEDGTPSTNHRKGMADIGVIAQEVEALGIAGLTTTRDNGVMAVRYDRLVPILIEAIKELSAKVTALEGS